MPVLTPRGEVVGVLEDADLLAASARQSFMLRRSIALATDAAELQQVGQRVTGMAVELFRNGTKATATSAILSVVIDSLVRRALELVLAQPDNRQRRRIRVADARQCRAARSDAVLRRRQRAVVAGLTLAERAPRLRAVAAARARHARRLRDAGGPQRCDRRRAVVLPFPVGVAGRGPRMARRSVARPGHDLVVAAHRRAGRVGRPALHTVPAAYQRMRDEHPNALRLQLLDALSGKVRDPVAARRAVAAGRNVRPEEPRGDADRQSRPLGWADRGCHVGDYPDPAGGGGTGGRPQRERRPHAAATCS